MARVCCALFVMVAFLVEVIEPSTPFVRIGTTALTQHTAPLSPNGSCTTLHCPDGKTHHLPSFPAAAVYHSAESQESFYFIVEIHSDAFRTVEAKLYQSPDLKRLKAPPRISIVA